MSVCVVYFHTIWQINEDTIQCRIVVTVWEKFSRFRWFSSCELTSLLGSLRGGGEKHEGFAGWKMSIQVTCSQNFYFSHEKKAGTGTLWSLWYWNQKYGFVDDRKNLYHCLNQECHKVMVTILVLIIRSSHTISYSCCRSLHRRWSLSEVVL